MPTAAQKGMRGEENLKPLYYFYTLSTADWKATRKTRTHLCRNLYHTL